MECYHQESIKAVGTEGSARSTNKIPSTGWNRLDASRVNHADLLRSDVEDTANIIQDELLIRMKLYETKRAKKANSTDRSQSDELQECVGENIFMSYQNMSPE